MNRATENYDLLVIGGGVAGLSAALRASELGQSVLIVDKSGHRYPHATTHLAQGGLAVVGLADQPPGDSVDSHVKDTLQAGALLNDAATTHSIIEGGAEAVEWLIGHGARFDVTGGRYNRTLEGGHSHKRIIHAGGDQTGAEIERALIASTGQIPTRHAEVTAITEEGVLTSSGPLRGAKVLIATGGCGQLFEATTAPEGARGQGMALAIGAGAELKNMEFIQFHPTVLRTPHRGRKPLLSEALRGEGARIVDRHGAPVTNNDLAPRDVVARAVARAGEAFLDARDVPNVRERFPTVTLGAATMGLDPARDLLPITPAAHYTCGGIAADAHGRTAVPGLYAAGECACTGLHGANRLASNSLLEGLVVGRRVAEDSCAPARPTCSPRETLSSAELALLQHAMAQGAGILRTVAGLREAENELEMLPPAAETVVALAIVRAAIARPETLGCHTMAS